MEVVAVRASAVMAMAMAVVLMAGARAPLANARSSGRSTSSSDSTDLLTWSHGTPGAIVACVRALGGLAEAAPLRLEPRAQRRCEGMWARHERNGIAFVLSVSRAISATRFKAVSHCSR